MPLLLASSLDTDSSVNASASIDPLVSWFSSNTTQFDVVTATPSMQHGTLTPCSQRDSNAVLAAWVSSAVLTEGQ